MTEEEDPIEEFSDTDLAGVKGSLSQLTDVLDLAEDIEHVPSSPHSPSASQPEELSGDAAWSWEALWRRVTQQNIGASIHASKDDPVIGDARFNDGDVDSSIEKHDGASKSNQAIDANVPDNAPANIFRSRQTPLPSTSSQVSSTRRKISTIAFDTSFAQKIHHTILTRSQAVENTDSKKMAQNGHMKDDVYPGSPKWRLVFPTLDLSDDADDMSHEASLASPSLSLRI
ncbi:hypothetical protein BZG36_00370 [Bifiguratus adelaidae]|uniref:Uncharacterized protein n=1 Tax=Bifiguratus adelaidae TaxID=1938954 RepID=A0A261Y7M1_9FUNG|nr:hypothetical protein BZG36_00370 [Bifiguratus adelaidae]